MVGNEGTEMPAWMRLQIQEAKEEKREARRRAEEAGIREAEWKRDQQARDYERNEREERERREQRENEGRERQERYSREAQEKSEKDEREREDRRFRTEQQNNWMKLGAGLVTAFIESRNPPPITAPDLNSTLLSAVVANMNKPQAGSTNTSVLEQIKILTALDELRGGNKGEDKEDSDFMKMMSMAGNALPAIAAMRGGPAQQQQAMMQQQAMAGPSNGESHQPSAEEFGHQILTNPEVISQISMKDPQTVAASMVAAVKGNSALKDAVVEEFQKQGM